ncbi:putative transcription factor bHLH041 [Musa acuminata AAA Group]|uniref:putative transcription factor bHLH041 n=1 Tax=Musa acuminata AAA Group TaxID=214697 RepID=UPI0031DFF61C
MDSIFLLSPDARSRFLRTAGRVLGCSYICLWSHLYHPPSNYLTAMVGWHRDDDSTHPSSSSGSPSMGLFDAYRSSICDIQHSCVPGLAYKNGLPYFELGVADLMDLASMRVQRQFYQEAGIKTAFFLGCPSGEIELGMTSPSNTNMQINVQRVFSEDFIRQSQLGSEEFIQQAQLGQVLPIPDQSRLSSSSSSSSLRSRSVGSAEHSSSGRSIMPDSALPRHVTMQAYGRYRNVLLPSAARDDAEITRAMIVVISSTSSSTTLMSFQTSEPAAGRSVGAFKPYCPALAPKSNTNPSLHGQKMIKKVIMLLTTMNPTRFEAPMQDARTSSNQMHHMISERKRREKLNESFDALRMLLPRGSKKDKASVLDNTRNYLNTLRTQISELDERNRLLEVQLRHQRENEEDGDPNETVQIRITGSSELEERNRLPEVQLRHQGEEEEDGDPNEIVQVRITWSSESTSETQRINIGVTVRVECNAIDMILNVLERLKRMRGATLVSVETSTRLSQTNVRTKASLTLQVKSGDCDEEAFKEAVVEAAYSALAASSTTAP